MDFQELCIQWERIQASIPPKEWEKLQRLFISDNIEQVASTLDLLCSYGEAALSLFLKEKEGGLFFRKSMVVYHHTTWLRHIFSEIRDEKSLWFPLYQRGYFQRQELQLYSKMKWNILTEKEKASLLAFSTRAVCPPISPFFMGADQELDEQPRHQVILTQEIMVHQYPCTQVLYASVMGSNPSTYAGATRPVEMVSWCDAVLFCNKLSEREGLEPCYILPKKFENSNSCSQQVQWKRSANGYRLPTEAEWEFCAKGGEEYIFAGSNDIGEVAYFRDNCKDISVIGRKKPNAFDLYDMSGNVWEWCWDTYKENLYTKEERVDPVCDQESFLRVCRGGSYQKDKHLLRNAYRYRLYATYRRMDMGFRVVRSCLN